MLTLWSIQTEEAYQELKTSKVLRGTYERVDPDWHHAYLWMMAQMEKRIGPSPAKGVYPVWAWKQWHKEGESIDLSQPNLLYPGTQGVLLTIEVDPAKVLLSDFDRWHDVLNNWPCANSKKQLFSWDIKPPKNIEKTWDRIFELEGSYYESLGDFDDLYVQATMWELPLTSVVKVEHFTATGIDDFR